MTSTFRVLLATVAMTVVACGGDDDDTSPSEPTTATTAAPVNGMDFVDGSQVDLGDGWVLGPCEGGPQVFCADLEGETQATVELVSFPATSFDAIVDVLDRGGSVGEALRAHAAEFHVAFQSDRAAGCGADYTLTTFGPEAATVAGREGVVYGFDGSDGGRHVERALQFATIDGDTLHLIVTTAVEDGTCMDDGELLEFTVAELTLLEPVLADAVAEAVLPPG